MWRLTGVKLEVGSVATPLDVVSFDEDYLRCLRYYQKSLNYGTAPGTNAGANTGEFIFTNPVAALTAFNSIWVPFSVPMAAVPVLTLYNPDAANNQVRNRNTGTDCTASTTSIVSQQGFQLQGITPASSGPSQTMAVHWGASLS